MPGANSRQQEATDRACRSPTLFSEVIASKNAILRGDIHFSEADSKGSNGAIDKPSNTMDKSQAETLE